MPTATPVRKRVPSAFICSRRRSTCSFSILKSGIPYRRRPPILSSRSYTATVWPTRVSCCATASPAGPEPTTATVLPLRRAGGSGLTQPFSNAWSTIETSTCLMVTAGWLMPSTQDASQGAGQSRPVNSGKLLVACSRSIASSPLSRQMRSFHSGMRLPSGQPWWQNGTPQSMQRPACAFRTPFSWAS